MLGRANGAVLIGIEAVTVQVEVDLRGGLPVTSTLGLAGSAVREGLDRIRSAVSNAGLDWPVKRIIVSLAPADLPKQGAGLDLPIAAAILAAHPDVALRFDPAGVMLAGELSLDGRLRAIRGALSIAMAAFEAGQRTLLVPRANAEEAALVEGLEVVALGGIADLVAWARGQPFERVVVDGRALLRCAADQGAPDLSEVRGQAGARRALEVAAAGGHHLLFSGPPGSGKTMMARRLPGILPPLALDEALEVTRVWGAAGLSRGLVTRRPFRAPHHGISSAGLAGGGATIRPGEITLATHGVLYLDELPEFRRDALETLRQPIEEGTITVVRVRASATLPARFALVASMNPCPCGWHGDRSDRCRCSPQQIERYRGRVSGPLLDRFDLRVEVPRLDAGALADARPGESSAAVRARVLLARERQRARFTGSATTCNARMGPADLARWAALRGEPLRLLLAACERLGLTARGFDRVRRVARTVADLDGTEAIEPSHVAEALGYRAPDAGEA